MSVRLLIAFAALALTGSAVAATPRPSVLLRVPGSTPLAALLEAHSAFSAPRSGAHILQRVSVRRPLTEQRTVLPVIGHATDPHGAQWLHVLLPGRPNGHAGWIKQSGTRAGFTRWALVVHLSSRRVLVYRAGRVVHVFKAIVGKPSTPTPQGHFFVEEAVALGATDVGAPFALALSARSNVLQEFDGGPGQIALHGLMNVGGILGTAVSHGCVRLANASMRWLVLRIAPGAPVTVIP